MYLIYSKQIYLFIIMKIGKKTPVHKLSTLYYYTQFEVWQNMANNVTLLHYSSVTLTLQIKEETSDGRFLDQRFFHFVSRSMNISYTAHLYIQV